MGPHPAVAAVRRAVRDALACGRGRVLVACSGGADSTALAAAVAFEAPRAGRVAGLATVDHGLQNGSGSRARTVAAVAAELGLDPVLVLPVEVGTQGGPEAAARSARYAALDAAAEALDADLLLGHTLDDQAETVLLGLGRGSGPRSIAGMRAGDGRRCRPLLGVRRATTRAACEVLGLPVWDDPHNTDPTFQRVRLRHEVLPLLEDVLQGGVAEALARTADLLRDDLDTLDAEAERVLAVGHPERAGDPAAWGPAAGDLDVAGVADLPAAVRTRVLRAWARGRGAAPLAAGHVAALDALIVHWHGQGAVDLPGGISVRRASGRLKAVAGPSPEPPPTDVQE